MSQNSEIIIHFSGENILKIKTSVPDDTSSDCCFRNYGKRLNDIADFFGIVDNDKSHDAVGDAGKLKKVVIAAARCRFCESPFRPKILSGQFFYLTYKSGQSRV
jgi:DNA polymerase III epsilon subunit-like protein